MSPNVNCKMGFFFSFITDLELSSQIFKQNGNCECFDVGQHAVDGSMNGIWGLF